jgi:adenine-specific DNA-methyltransferase
MPKSKTGTAPRRQKTTKLETLKHKDKRVNIPTEELRDFVAEEEKAPKTILYPRDPSLDPQLVWKGKDEQDAKPLEVPAVPIYIQEKIHPQAIIEDFFRTAKKEAEPQMQLYADFNGLPGDFEKRVDFYHYDQNWSNRMILGDSLLVMTSLAEKEGLKGKVQMIFVDPPYGIRFGSNWQVSTRKKEVKDGKAEDVNREPEVLKAFRDTWEKGIHSYLAYLRDRLSVAHQLLTDSGSVFVQIGDTNVHLVRNLLDEAFGSNNFCAQITFKKTGYATSELLPSTSDILVWYAKDRKQVKYRQLYSTKELGIGIGDRYNQLELPDGSYRPIFASEMERPSLIPEDCKVWMPSPLTSSGFRANTSVPFDFQKKRFDTGSSQNWKTTLDGLRRLAQADRIVPSKTTLNFKRFLVDFPAVSLTTAWEDTMGAADGSKIYVVQTATRVVERCILMTTDPGDLLLDPTCGSGTTAYVAEQWGRRWITTDTSRVALALARTRLMAGRFPYYLLADSASGIQKVAAITGSVPSETKSEGDVKKGFVYRRVPHVTLKSIANNEEIDTICAAWQNRVETARAELNKLLKQKWEEWQVPREADQTWPSKVKEQHELWWKLRRERQKEIDASIARHADTEVLNDQPYEDTSRLRVTGPFTVESLSPHRVIATDEDKRGSKAEASAEFSASFTQTIIENLRKAGVQNNIKNERLKFERLDPYAGIYINAAGEYLEGSKTKRVAICLGPEYGTVGPDLVKEAAKEAVQGLGFDLLIVCGFAFDPHVGEEVKRYGKLVILPTRMNNDLAMGDELLKKTGAGNLFMVFGEPDIDIDKQKDGTLTVTVKGVDVYDPTTGQIRNSSTDDIACWFIDTDYNGESFFVRHAYFTGADEPYEKLKKALRAEIDEAAWASIYSTVSRPFPRPQSRDKKPPQIAVKVINHYGDEVMKVFKI